MRLRRNKLVEFDELTHSYWHAGSRLIGVTGLLHKHDLAPDLNGIPEEVLNAAAARGTAIHELLENYDNGKAVKSTEELEAYRKLCLAVHCSEYLVSDNETVATFIDKVLEDCSLVDVKTWANMDKSRKKYVTWQQSICAYLFEKQNPGKKVPHIYCARVRDGKAELIELNRIPDEKVEELIRCESIGVKYVDLDDTPSVDLALKEGDAVALADALDKIAQYKLFIKEQEEIKKEIENRLFIYMTENNLDEMQCPSGVFTLKKSYEKTSVDAKKLEKDMPEVFEKYKKVSMVKGSISFKANS